MDALGAIGLSLYAFRSLGKTPALGQVAIALLLTLASGALLYALSILVVSAAFWVVRLDNLLYLVNTLSYPPILHRNSGN